MQNNHGDVKKKEMQYKCGDTNDVTLSFVVVLSLCFSLGVLILCIRGGGGNIHRKHLFLQIFPLLSN